MPVFAALVTRRGGTTAALGIEPFVLWRKRMDDHRGVVGLKPFRFDKGRRSAVDPASRSGTLCSRIAISSSVFNPNNAAISGGNPSAASQQCATVRAHASKFHTLAARP